MVPRRSGKIQLLPEDLNSGEQSANNWINERAVFLFIVDVNAVENNIINHIELISFKIITPTKTFFSLK